MGLTSACAMYHDIPRAFAFTGVCAVGSIFPDIDIKNSTIGKKLKISGTIMRTLLSHRSITHTPLFGALTAWLLYLLYEKYGMPIYIVNAWILGYLIHLLQDTFTKKGIKWFFPIYNKSISLLKMRSSSKWGYFISLILYFVGTSILIYYISPI